jgi:hypothetical protein
MYFITQIYEAAHLSIKRKKGALYCRHCYDDDHHHKNDNKKLTQQTITTNDAAELQK